MRNLFSPDSKLMQALGTLADYIFLNILFILLCIPVITIGAAKTALYRVMFDMAEMRGNTYKRFFKAFAAEFKTVTPLGFLKTVIMVFLALEALLMSSNKTAFLAQITLRSPVIIVLLLTMLIVGMAFSSIPAQVSVFAATRKEYLRNGIYIALTKPLRCLLVALMDILPIFALMWNPEVFALLGVLWFFFYFSVTVNLSVRLWKKPFDQYIANAENQN